MATWASPTAATKAVRAGRTATKAVAIISAVAIPPASASRPASSVRLSRRWDE
jgi:hypothetical protein